MKSESGKSGSSSGGTSETKPPAPDTPPEKLSEQEYLAQQAESAKLALTGAWQEMKTRLAQGVAPQVWAKEYPWITVGAAAVAGFVAATALVPSKEEQALKKLAAPHLPSSLTRLERAVNRAHATYDKAQVAARHEQAAGERPPVESDSRSDEPQDDGAVL